MDLARAIAVFGMFAAHIGPDPARERGFVGWLMQLAHGRSAILFATLAGFSLMLISGRQLRQGLSSDPHAAPKSGLAVRQARVWIAIRAVVLLAVGTGLTMIGTPVAVILAYYGIYFLLALPLLGLSARRLAVIAAALAIVAPPASFGLRLLLDRSAWAQAIANYDPITRLSGEGLLALLLTGVYPATTWMPFVFAGMALGQLDLNAPRVLGRLAVLGPLLALLGYGTSWLALTLFGSLRATLDAGAGHEGTEDSSPARLMVASPHSGTTFEIVGSLGVAITVLVCATVAMARLPRLRRLASPVIAVGAMSLSAYVAHILVIGVLGVRELPVRPPLILVGFIVGVVVLAALWARLFRRGPLEYLLNSTTKLATFVR